MNQPTESEFLDDVGLKKPDRSICPHLKAHVLEVCPITSDGIWIIAVKIGRKKGKYENSASEN